VSLKNKRLIANPGEEFGYSNIGYNLIGSVIANISARSFEDYMRDNILTQSNMRNSSFLMEDIPVDRLAVPHIRAPHIGTSPIYPYHRAHNPSGGLHASVVDMCQWCLTCLEHGGDEERAILKPAGFNAMWTPTIGRGGLPALRDMGLGWIVGTYEGVKTTCHLGGSAGLNSFLVIMPEKDIAATLMFNAESQAIYRLLWASLDVLVGKEPQAKTVSWMIPISQALTDGGIEKARECAAQLREDERHEEYFVESSSLVMLAHQLIIGEEIDLAIGVLKLNIDAFPESADSYLLLAHTHLSKGDVDRAKDCLDEILTLDPDNTRALEILEEVRTFSG
jgi:CubicO group peptidase (beta-lactamase class C family)